MEEQNAFVCKGLISSVTFGTDVCEALVLPANLKTD